MVITWQRRAEALAAVARLTELPERPPVVLVDNGSADGTAEAVRSRFPSVRVIALSENLGAAGRNLGVRELDTPYVAFCDDDTWWEPGSLTRAADLLDAHPGIAVLNARIVVEPGGHDDPIVRELRESPVPGPHWLPGPALGSFLAGASVVRRDPFLAHGGFSGRLWLGGEEELLATDLLSGGWELCYRDDLVVHHQVVAVPGRPAAPPRGHPQHPVVHLAAPAVAGGAAPDDVPGPHGAPRPDLGAGRLGRRAGSAVAGHAAAPAPGGGRGPARAAGRGPAALDRPPIRRLNARVRAGWRSPGSRPVSPARRPPRRPRCS
ncbi:hypothetical protein Ani05nite_80980 [Amorphoplanes nipponensis]|uniref:Glycosyltransferase 2-like domain-containing protein n=1 Tax=Actinoplanes nipponensis TaxID=135950 RepID=A0A919JX02_9ACTN|nr:hypothetical protein Ani05nite_80980 [Actinoplanes nipponensis]